MDVVAIYAIAAGGILVAFFFIQTLSSVTSWADFFRIFVSRHLTLPFVIRRHRLCGPWTRAGVLLHLTYMAVNLLLIFFKINSLAGAGRRAGELALVNLVFPLSAIHLSYLADLLGITWKSCLKIHRATGWMTASLLSFHMIVALQTQNFTFPLREVRNLFTLLVRIASGIQYSTSGELTCNRPQFRWACLSYFLSRRFDGCLTRSSSEHIRFSLGSLSMALGDTFPPTAMPQAYISWLLWVFLG